MTDENQKQEQEYQSRPRIEARIPGIDLTCCDRGIEECNQFFLKHVDETDYRNLDWYLQRAQLRFAAGDDMIDVLDDLFMAARCLHERAAMHLELKPPEMFITRRVLPVELGILSGMPTITMEFAATYGLPLMMIFAKEAPDELISEACLLSTCFRRQDVSDCKDFYELYGLAAGIYAGAIAAIGRGFDDEAMIGINAYLRARDARPLQRMKPPASLIPKLNRYDDLIMALAFLCYGQFEKMGPVLADAAENFIADGIKRAGGEQKFLSPEKQPMPKYFDSAIVTVLALAALRDNLIPLPTEGPIAAYDSFKQAFVEIPERRIEVPGLDEEARQILQQAGIDPDDLANQGLVDNSFEAKKEEAENRALEILQERQRAAQEAIRKKLAEEAQNPPSEEDTVKPETYVKEHLKLSEDDEQEAPKPKAAVKDFTNFFSEGDDDSLEIRQGHKESEEGLPEPEKSVRNFANMFDGEEPSQETQNDDDEVDFSANSSQKFSQFFSESDENDEVRRASIEEASQDLQNKGHSFNSFFDNLDETAIPKFDDGSSDDVSRIDTFSADFFTDDGRPDAAETGAEEDESAKKRDFTEIFTRETVHQVTDLKMTSDTPDEPVEPVEAPKAKPAPAPVATIPEGFEEEAKNLKNFAADFFTKTDAPSTDLKMSEDGAAPATKVEPSKAKPEKEEEESQNVQSKTFSADFFTKAATPSSDLKMSEDGNWNQVVAHAGSEDEDRRLRNEEEEDYTTLAQPKRFSADFFAKAAEPSSDLKMAEDGKEVKLVVHEEKEEKIEETSTVDYKNFFEGEEAAERKTKLDADELRRQQEEQLKELAAAQAEREKQKAEQTAALKLEISPDEEEEAPYKPESKHDVLERIQREKDLAAREAALRLREEEQKELMEQAQKAPQAVTSTLQLQLTPTKLEDEVITVSKLEDDFAVSPYTYTDLDMIHDNIAEREDLEEDFSVRDMMINATAMDETPVEAENHDDDDNLRVNVNYDEDKS